MVNSVTYFTNIHIFAGLNVYYSVLERYNKKPVSILDIDTLYCCLCEKFILSAL